MIVVADTTPLNYLVLIGQAELLPRLFGRVLLPPAVWEELQHPDTPEPVRAWLRQPPEWLRIHSLLAPPDPQLAYLDGGEQEALALALELHADQLLLDETDARAEAARRNVPVIGTLGVLRRAAHFDWIDLPTALGQLQQTTFYVKSELIDSLLREDAGRKKKRE